MKFSTLKCWWSFLPDGAAGAPQGSLSGISAEPFPTGSVVVETGWKGLEGAAEGMELFHGSCAEAVLVVVDTFKPSRSLPGDCVCVK